MVSEGDLLYPLRPAGRLAARYRAVDEADAPLALFRCHFNQMPSRTAISVQLRELSSISIEMGMDNCLEQDRLNTKPPME